METRPQLSKSKVLAQLLTVRAQMGTRSLQNKMKPYVYEQETSGVYILNVNTIYDKAFMAARIISSMCRKDMSKLLVVASRTYSRTPALMFSQGTGSSVFAGKWTPGTLTNQTTKTYREPSLMLVCDANIDKQAINETMYSNIPVIALCDTDADLSGVCLAVPCNTKNNQSVAYVLWLIAHMTQTLLEKELVHPETQIPLAFDHFLHVDSERVGDEANSKRNNLSALFDLGNNRDNSEVAESAKGEVANNDWKQSDSTQDKVWLSFKNDQHQ